MFHINLHPVQLLPGARADSFTQVWINNSVHPERSRVRGGVEGAVLNEVDGRIPFFYLPHPTSSDIGVILGTCHTTRRSSSVTGPPCAPT